MHNTKLAKLLPCPPALQQLGQRVPEVAQGAGAHAGAVRELPGGGARLHQPVPLAPQPLPGMQYAREGLLAPTRCMPWEGMLEWVELCL